MQLARHISPRNINPAMQHTRSSTICCAAPSTKNLRLWYFPATARAETTRLLLTLGKVPFEDKRVKREDWPQVKTQMPFGQMPVLEVDGKMLPQQNAIERYAARTVGMYPSDAWEAAQVDAMVNAIAELQEVFLRTFFMKDPAEKAAALKEVVEGPLDQKLSRLDSILAGQGPSGYLVGSKMTWADVSAFSMLSFIVSGFIPGVPTDLYNKYPHVKAFRTRMASLPEIKAYYEAQKDDPTRAAFRP